MIYSPYNTFSWNCKDICWESIANCHHWASWTHSYHSLPHRGDNDPRSLQWRHNDHDGFSNHQPHGCLLNRLFGRRSKKTSKFRVTGLCVGTSPGPVNFPHKGPVTRKMFPFDDVIVSQIYLVCLHWYRVCDTTDAEISSLVPGRHACQL